MTPSEYYLLALSQNLVRLYKISDGKISKVESKALPENIDKALWMDDFTDSAVQHHTTRTIGPNAKGGMAFHGHGGKKDYKPVALFRYVKILDSKINEIIKYKTMPLMLFCDKRLFSEYKKASTYPLLLEKYVQGNPDNLKRKELMSKIKELLSS